MHACMGACMSAWLANKALHTLLSARLPAGPQAAEDPTSFDANCLAKVTTAVIKLGYSDEELLVPLLDTAVGKLPEFTPKAVVELVSGGGTVGSTVWSTVAQLAGRAARAGAGGCGAGEGRSRAGIRPPSGGAFPWLRFPLSLGLGLAELRRIRGDAPP